MTLDDLNRQLRKGAARAGKFRAPIEQAYVRVLRQARSDALTNLDRYATTLTASADWIVPDVNEIYDALKVAGDLQRSVSGLREEALRAQIGGVLASLGVRFDLKNPLIADLLASMGQKITYVSESQRAEIMHTINEAWQDGLGLPETARLVASRSSIAGVARGLRIARTEIVGIQNGGALAAAKMSGVANTKTWLTAPGAPHPRHENYPDLDGQTVTLGDLFQVGDAMLDHPGDPDGPPEEVIQCRCTTTFGE